MGSLDEPGPAAATSARAAPLARLFLAAQQEQPLVQGTYFIASGVWPLVHMASFEMVTGRKRDRWLVKTVALLVAVVGVVLLRSRSSATPDPALLGAGTAASLATVDVVYVLRREISPVYLLDALAETSLVAAWIVRARTRRR